MAITKNNLRSNLYSTLYTHLNTYVSDPDSRSKQWIFSSYPDYTAPNFIGYPIIVINKMEVDKSFETFDNTNSEKTVPLIVGVFSTKASVVDTVSDSVDVAMAMVIDKSLTHQDYSEQEGQIIIKNKPVHYRLHKYMVSVDL